MNHEFSGHATASVRRERVRTTLALWSVNYDTLKCTHITTYIACFDISYFGLETVGSIFESRTTFVCFIPGS